MARILVIDSSEDLISTSKQILEKEGYSYIVQGCQSFDTGLFLVQESVPDLIILNLDASNLVELHHILHAPETAFIPLIVVATNHGSLGRLICITALWYGACDYLLKPFTELELVERVHSQMKLS